MHPDAAPAPDARRAKKPHIHSGWWGMLRLRRAKRRIERTEFHPVALGIIHHRLIQCFTRIAINYTARAGATTKIYCAIGICSPRRASPSDIVGLTDTPATMRMNVRTVTDFHHRNACRIARHRVSTPNTWGGFNGVKKHSIGIDGGIFYGNGSTRRADCTAYPCSHIPTHAIPASVRNNSHIANSDVATGSAII